MADRHIACDVAIATDRNPACYDCIRADACTLADLGMCPDDDTGSQLHVLTYLRAGVDRSALGPDRTVAFGIEQPRDSREGMLNGRAGERDRPVRNCSFGQVGSDQTKPGTRIRKRADSSVANAKREVLRSCTFQRRQVGNLTPAVGARRH